MVNFYKYLLLNMNLFNQKSFLENEIRETFAKKARWELNCCEILPGSGIPDKIPQHGLGTLAENGDPNPGISRWPNMEVPPLPSSYSYGELTIENIKEAYIRHFTHQFQLSKNVACSVLAI